VYARNLNRSSKRDKIAKIFDDLLRRGTPELGAKLLKCPLSLDS